MTNHLLGAQAQDLRQGIVDFDDEAELVLAEGGEPWLDRREVAGGGHRFLALRGHEYRQHDGVAVAQVEPVHHHGGIGVAGQVHDAARAPHREDTVPCRQHPDAVSLGDQVQTGASLQDRIVLQRNGVGHRGRDAVRPQRGHRRLRVEAQQRGQQGAQRGHIEVPVLRAVQHVVCDVA